MQYTKTSSAGSATLGDTSQAKLIVYARLRREGGQHTETSTTKLV